MSSPFAIATLSTDCDPLAKELIERGEWKQHIDKKTGKIYFSNVETKKVVWNLSAHLAKHHHIVSNHNNNNGAAKHSQLPNSVNAFAETSSASSVSGSAASPSSPPPPLLPAAVPVVAAADDHYSTSVNVPGQPTPMTTTPSPSSSASTTTTALLPRVTAENLRKQQELEQQQQQQVELLRQRDHEKQEEVQEDEKTTKENATAERLLRQHQQRQRFSEEISTPLQMTSTKRPSPPAAKIPLESEVGGDDDNNNKPDGNLNDNETLVAVHGGEPTSTRSLPPPTSLSAQSLLRSAPSAHTSPTTFSVRNNNNNNNSNAITTTFSSAQMTNGQTAADNSSHRRNDFILFGVDLAPSDPLHQPLRELASTSPLATIMADKYLRDYDKNKAKFLEEKSKPTAAATTATDDVRFKTTPFDSMKSVMMKKADARFLSASTSKPVATPTFFSSSSSMSTSTTRGISEHDVRCREAMRELRRQLVNDQSTDANINKKKCKKSPATPLPWQRFVAASSLLSAGLNEKMARIGVSAHERRKYFSPSSATSLTGADHGASFFPSSSTSPSLETSFCLAVFPPRSSTSSSSSTAKSSSVCTVWAATCSFIREESSLNWRPHDVVGRVRGIVPLFQGDEERLLEGTDENESERDDLFHGEEVRETKSSSLGAVAAAAPAVVIRANDKIISAAERGSDANSPEVCCSHLSIDPSSHVVTVFGQPSFSSPSPSSSSSSPPPHQFLVAFLIVGLGSSLPPIERLHRPFRGVCVSNLLDACKLIFPTTSTTTTISPSMSPSPAQLVGEAEVTAATVCDAIVSLVAFSDQVIVSQLEASNQFHERVQDNQVQTSLLRAFEREQELKLTMSEQGAADDDDDENVGVPKQQHRQQQRRYVNMKEKNRKRATSPSFATQYISDEIREMQLLGQRNSGNFAARFAAPPGGSVAKMYDVNTNRIVVDDGGGQRAASGAAGAGAATSSVSGVSSSWKDMNRHFKKQQQPNENNINNNKDNINNIGDSDNNTNSSTPANSSMQLLFSTIRGSSHHDHERQQQQQQQQQQEQSEPNRLHLSPTTRSFELRRAKNVQHSQLLHQQQQQQQHQSIADCNQNKNDDDNDTDATLAQPQQLRQHQHFRHHHDHHLVGTPSTILEHIYDRILATNPQTKIGATRSVTSKNAASSSSRQYYAEQPKNSTPICLSSSSSRGHRHYHRYHHQDHQDHHPAFGSATSAATCEATDISVAEVAVGVLLELEREKTKTTSSNVKFQDPSIWLASAHRNSTSRILPAPLHHSPSRILLQATTPAALRHQNHHHREHHQEREPHGFAIENDDHDHASQLVQENNRLLKELVMQNLVRF